MHEMNDFAYDDILLTASLPGIKIRWFNEIDFGA